MTLKHPTHWQFRHYKSTPGGRRLIWASTIGDVDALEGTPEHKDIVARQEWLENDLSNEGQNDILATYFRGESPSANLFFRLFDATPVRTDTLSSLAGEVSGSGYGPIQLARNSTDWPTLELDGAGTLVRSDTKTFAATGTWTDATRLILATSNDNSGLLIAYAPLSTTRTLVENDTLDVSMSVKST